MDLIVPVKHLAAAKTRLKLPRALVARRAELVLAMALDTVAAAERAEQVGLVEVLTADVAVADAFRRVGVLVVFDESTGGLNAAIEHAATRRRGRRSPGVLLADLPALRSRDVDLAVAEADGRGAFCPDHRGRGTTLLLAGATEPLAPCFERNSAERHRGLGIHELDLPGRSLRHDVDTWDDLLAAAALGLGQHTTRIVREVAARGG